MYICEDCGSVFEEPKRKQITFESYYGVSDLFDSRTRMDLLTCPLCDSEDFEEAVECDCCERLVREVHTTEDIPNCQFRSVCEECLEKLEEDYGRD